jgi:hypothetical protein
MIQKDNIILYYMKSQNSKIKILKNEKTIKINNYCEMLVKNKINNINFDLYFDEINKHVLLQKPYKSDQLKLVLKYYNLKISGNKEEIKTRIFTFIYLSFYACKIQKLFRGNLQRKYNKLHGPAIFNRSLCTNTDDFITMNSLKEIKYNQFFSFKDNDNFIYGFEISSIYNLFIKEGNEEMTKNPYNRKLIPINVFYNLNRIIKLNKIFFKNQINLQIEDDTQNIMSEEKKIELRALTLFQNINSLGNYSDPKWFLSLNRIRLIHFIRELNDIWNFRAQLSVETKREICFPYGNPFQNLFISTLIELEINSVKNIILNILENFVNLGINNDSKSLGCYYVLSALTLVNNDAAQALPWLYESVI